MLKRIAMGVILFIYIILIFFSACTSLTKKQPHISHVKLMDTALSSFEDNFLPNQNFVFLEKYAYFNEKEQKFCSGDDLSIDCSFVPYGEGSAIAVKSIKNNVKILTAHHVCEEQMWEALNLIFENKDGEYDYPTFKIKAHFYGKEYTANIVKTDEDNDLCLLEIESEYGYKVENLKVADKKPELGETLYSISAPLGISSKYTRLHFHGAWAGCDDALTGLPFCYFTIPAAPGSSGSGVFNRQGELVSIISIAMSGFDEISGGPRQYFIKELIKN